MMAISTRTFKTIVSSAVSVVQGAATALVDFSQGSINLALIRAAAGISLWLQGLILQVAALTRLSTSTGSDVDSYLGDFGAKRKGAVSSSGEVTFSRVTATIAATIQVGTSVQTPDGQKFSVIADTAQPAFNATLNAYVIPVNTSSAAATVQAVTPGAAGNVAGGLISVLGQSIVGVDAVTNGMSFSNGADAESDSDARASFQAFLQNLTEGTKQACINAAQGIQEGVVCVILENQSLAGNPQPGYFAAIIDDGSGSPSQDLLTAAYAAIDAVRAEGTIFGVFPPNVVTANVVMTVTVAAGFNATTVKNAIRDSITAFVNALKLGNTLPYTILSKLAYDAVPGGITNVTAITLNSGTADLTATGQQLIRAGTVTVN